MIIETTERPPDRATAPQSHSPVRTRRRGRFAIAGLIAVVGGIATMWVYAFGFAPREAVNKVLDAAWAERGEAICAAARRELDRLAVIEFIDEPTVADMRQRAQLVRDSTGVLERMLTDVTSVMPADAKGRGIVPLWEADYRAYLADRLEYADRLHAGDNASFSETALEGIPISEKLETFARDNRMDSCVPPYDLSV